MSEDLPARVAVLESNVKDLKENEAKIFSKLDRVADVAREAHFYNRVLWPTVTVLATLLSGFIVHTFL